MVFPYFLNTKQVGDFVNATFMWCMRGYVYPPQLLPKDYCGLCPDFNLEVAETFTKDVHIPELAHATFYAMVLNDALVLGVECLYMTDVLILVLEWLNWGTFESWLESQREHLLREHS